MEQGIQKKVLVALSGGLDSAAVVLFLREAGYHPRAMFLDMLDSQEQRALAIATAESLNVELIIEPVAELFRDEVLKYVLAEHVAGRTPAPCSRCNPRIKWHLLAQVADRLGIYHIATGHYVQKITHTYKTDTATEQHIYFSRGVDPVKDQSYYLWDVPEQFIERAVLPLGAYTKAEVREALQERYGLTELSQRKESMGVCFLDGHKRYGDFLRNCLPTGSIRSGEVEDLSGRVVGTHDGYPLYTAGQKRGFAITDNSSQGEGANNGKLAVADVDASRNVVVVATNEALFHRTLTLKEWRATCPDELSDRSAELLIMVRGIGRNPAGGCRLTVLADGLLQITLLQESAWALACGQPVVFYLDDRVVGGGILNSFSE